MAKTNEDTYYIIYPGCRHGFLKVIRPLRQLSREEAEASYDFASRQTFTDLEKAQLYARKLAKENGLIYEPGPQERVYLD